jgi:hypothetical protein
MQSSAATRYLSYAFSAEEPPMTAWALEAFKTTKPSFGPRAVEDSNDPVNPTTVNALGCFPPGVPRIYLHPFPMEIVQTPGRVLMLFEFNDKTWIDRAGHPHSDALHVVERLRRVDQTTLQNDITIEDPKAYFRPWGGRIRFQSRPTWNITEMVCEDNINFEEFLKSEMKPKK